MSRVISYTLNKEDFLAWVRGDGAGHSGDVFHCSVHPIALWLDAETGNYTELSQDRRQWFFQGDEDVCYPLPEWAAKFVQDSIDLANRKSGGRLVYRITDGEIEELLADSVTTPENDDGWEDVATNVPAVPKLKFKQFVKWVRENCRDNTRVGWADSEGSHPLANWIDELVGDNDSFVDGANGTWWRDGVEGVFPLPRWAEEFCRLSIEWYEFRDNGDDAMDVSTVLALASVVATNREKRRAKRREG